VPPGSAAQIKVPGRSQELAPGKHIIQIPASRDAGPQGDKK
jgi:hypothetical protein